MMWTTGLELFGLQLGKHVTNAETQVMRQTQQYRTTQETKLADWMASYDDAEKQIALVKDDPEAVATLRANQAGIVRQMKVFVSSGQIAKENVPTDVQEFLASH